MPEPRGGAGCLLCVLWSREPRTGPGAQWFPSLQPRSLSLSHPIVSPTLSHLLFHPLSSPPPALGLHSQEPLLTARPPPLWGVFPAAQGFLRRGRSAAILSDPLHFQDTANSLASNTRSLSTGPPPPSAATPVDPAHPQHLPPAGCVFSLAFAGVVSSARPATLLPER